MKIIEVCPKCGGELSDMNCRLVFYDSKIQELYYCDCGWYHVGDRPSTYKIPFIDPQNRLMSEEEIRHLTPGESVWRELLYTDDDGNPKVCKHVDQCVVTPDDNLYDEGGYQPLHRFDIVWKPDYMERYWKRKPTEEERRGTPWEKL